MSADFLKIKTIGDLKEWLVIIPAIHIFACFLYLFFYYYSFGHGVIRFASPTEVFSVSLSVVAPIYLFGGIGFLIGRWSHETAEEIDQRYSEKAAAVVKRSKAWQSKLLYGSAVILLIFGVISSYLMSYIFWNSFTLPVGLFVVAILSKYSLNYQFPPTAMIVALGLTAALTMITFRGLADGQEAARLTVEKFEQQPSCDKFVILKDVSENFLAIDQENNRLIIDDACKEKFRLINAADNAIYDGEGIVGYATRVRSID